MKLLEEELPKSKRKIEGEREFLVVEDQVEGSEVVLLLFVI